MFSFPSYCWRAGIFPIWKLFIEGRHHDFYEHVCCSVDLHYKEYLKGGKVPGFTGTRAGLGVSRPGCGLRPHEELENHGYCQPLLPPRLALRLLVQLVLGFRDNPAP